MAKVIIDNVREFERRVGVLEAADYVGMPIKPSIGHVFYDWDLDKLLAFAKIHPHYHIISGRQSFTYNRFVPDAVAWYLGDGDSDPEVTSVGTSRYWQRVAEAWIASKPRSGAKLR